MALTPFVRLLLTGTLTGAQTWSVGLSFEAGALVPAATLQTWLAAISPEVDTFWTTYKNLVGTDTTLSALRAYGYDSGGTKSATEASITKSSVGAATSPNLPTQCAMVVSLRSGNSSRSGRGRIYLPIRNAAQLSNGQLANANCDALAAAVKVLIDAIVTHPFGTGGSPIPAIATGGSKPPVPILSVQVDSKVDTQRRRTDKVAAVYRAVATL